MSPKKAQNQAAVFTGDTSFYHVKLAWFVSLLSWPITYVLNNAFQGIDQTARPFYMMACGFLLLGFVILLVAKFSHVNDFVYYGAVLFSFTAVIDLIITLEFNGIIRNFMSEYLNLGEPYLASPWGAAIALFDAIGFLPMYLGLIYLVSNGKNWRSLGIYWAAGIINSMVVLLLGIFCGKESSTFCSFLNVPYVFFPIYVFRRACLYEKRPTWKTSPRDMMTTCSDICLAMMLLFCTSITLTKGFTALAPENPGVDFLGFLDHEPSFLLNDPAPFSRIQAVVYLMYIVPLQVLTCCYLFCGYLPAYLWEMTLIHAGVMIQGQFSVIGLSLDAQTPPEYKSSWINLNFWFVNLFILIVPHLVLHRLHQQHADNDEVGKKHS